jgi:hypothetical protein
MTRTLHNRLRRAEKLLQLQKTRQAEREAERQQSAESQLEGAALWMLTDADLQVLRARSLTQPKASNLPDDPDGAALERYRAGNSSAPAATTWSAASWPAIGSGRPKPRPMKSPCT